MDTVSVNPTFTEIRTDGRYISVNPINFVKWPGKLTTNNSHELVSSIQLPGN